MAFGDDYGLEKGPGIVEIGGTTVNATAVLRKTGVNDSDVAFLVGRMQQGESWDKARRALFATRGAVDNAALEGWRKEIQRRASLDPNRPRTVKELTSLDVVLPAARNAKEQCTHVFSGLPPETSRCILKRHVHGGHMPGKPLFAGGALVSIPGSGTEAEPSAEARLASSPKEQCRHVSEGGPHEGTRCVLAMHDEVALDHVFDAALVAPPAPAPKAKGKGKPAKKAAKRAAPAKRTKVAAAPVSPPEDPPPFAPGD